jgi:Ca2+/Na+ antiporter
MTTFLMSYSDIKEQHKTATCILFFILFFIFLFYKIKKNKNKNKNSRLKWHKKATSVKWSTSTTPSHKIRCNRVPIKIPFFFKGLGRVSVSKGFCNISRIFHHMNKSKKEGKKKLGDILPCLNCLVSLVSWGLYIKLYLSALTLLILFI